MQQLKICWTCRQP